MVAKLLSLSWKGSLSSGRGDFQLRWLPCPRSFPPPALLVRVRVAAARAPVHVAHAAVLPLHHVAALAVLVRAAGHIHRDAPFLSPPLVHAVARGVALLTRAHRPSRSCRAARCALHRARTCRRFYCSHQARDRACHLTPCNSCGPVCGACRCPCRRGFY